MWAHRDINVFVVMHVPFAEMIAGYETVTCHRVRAVEYVMALDGRAWEVDELQCTAPPAYHPPAFVKIRGTDLLRACTLDNPPPPPPCFPSQTRFQLARRSSTCTIIVYM